MLSVLERKLVAVGYNAFDTVEKNTLIRELARREGVPYNEITEKYILEVHKLLKVRELSVKNDKTINEGFVASNGHSYRTALDDQINFLGTKDELDDFPEIAEVQWKTEDVGYVVHSREAWLAIYREAFQHKKSTLYRYNTLKLAVMEAKTHEELTAISWEGPLDEG